MHEPGANRKRCEDGLSAVLEYLTALSPAARAMYNSMGAWASVNHLHFHLYGADALPVENAPRRKLASKASVRPQMVFSERSSGFECLSCRF